MTDRSWIGTLNEILFGVQFDPLNEQTVEGVAQAMVDYRFFDSGPAAYVATIDAALSSNDVLTEALPVRHSEEDFRRFLGKLRERLVALRPWPEPAIRRLPVSEWATFGQARSIARIDETIHRVAERVRSRFEDVDAGEAKLPVLVLRLGTGETVALMGSTDRTAKGVHLMQRDPGDPDEVTEHFRELTGFAPEELERLA